MKRFSHTISIWLLSIWTLSAQNLLTNDNSLVVINPNVPFVVEGGILNEGLISNEGAMRLSGGWTNNGDYRSVSGTFLLDGENQIFSPGASSYNHLEINSGGVAVISDLTITETLDLVQGVVSLANDATIYLINEADVNGGNSNSYIDGMLVLSARENATFPIGTETDYLPVHISGITPVDSIGAKAIGPAIAATAPQEIADVSPNHHWQIIGSEDFRAEEITLPIRNETFLNDLNDAVIAFTTDPADPLKIVGLPEVSGSISDGIISSREIIKPGYYVLAAKGETAPPVTVVNLVTSLQDGKHDFLRIENIEFYPDNLVEIYDRQGIKVFEMRGYNNLDRVFRGHANVGSRGILETGNYYYTIHLTGSKREQGFVYVKN